ncbi:MULTISPECIES: NUDIX hydrolase [unclassified Paenibacillus]|uniref:NUDIX hydrolase n=1 Tax=unclassified Paenibacillus TaxID=185978 RepID=UPI0009A721CB|nr:MULTISPECIES: NUDIX domain-containing protein [unclassified Paenibacillus]SLK20085.1 ADP-ribose pyrophosphatase YjhB, NUDIX family [Paenibacillus sp. RU5A]SOC76051.1 ADP-ribose pyrophosphatase YjhB, NUDIX family [Paenibacillus sp. RU26A]SOC77773.1 ADP-ribose pyrophosphatase YjhB, NUDIX family [Paenibacillus sp. RU5M]
MGFPTHIVSAGGITEVGENLIDGVIREIKEESGIDATVSHLISVVSNTAIHKWYDNVTDVPTKVMFDFVCKAVGGALATSNETSECRWVPKEHVLDLITLPEIRMRYEAYLNFNGSVNYMEYVTASTTEFNVKLQRSV